MLKVCFLAGLALGAMEYAVFERLWAVANHCRGACPGPRLRPAIVMSSTENLILVVNSSEPAAKNLKKLIEFMDTPRVRIAAPDEWRLKLGEHRLEAMFVGPDLSDEELTKLLGDVGELDPNVPIVMMNEEDASE